MKGYICDTLQQQTKLCLVRKVRRLSEVSMKFSVDRNTDKRRIKWPISESSIDCSVACHMGNLHAH